MVSRGSRGWRAGEVSAPRLGSGGRRQSPGGARRGAGTRCAGRTSRPTRRSASSPRLFGTAQLSISPVRSRAEGRRRPARLCHPGAGLRAACPPLSSPPPSCRRLALLRLSLYFKTLASALLPAPLLGRAPGVFLSSVRARVCARYGERAPPRPWAWPPPAAASGWSPRTSFARVSPPSRPRSRRPQPSV